MFESLEGFSDVVGHGKIYCSVDVIPAKVDAAVLLGIPVNGDCVFGLESCDEMVGVFFSYIFDSKIVDYKAEGDWSGLVGKQSWSVLGLDVTVSISDGHRSPLLDCTMHRDAMTPRRSMPLSKLYKVGSTQWPKMSSKRHYPIIGALPQQLHINYQKVPVVPMTFVPP